MRGGRDHADPAGVDVDGDHRALGADQLGDGGAGPGRGEVGDALPRHGGERVHHRLAALVLRRGPTFTDRIEAGGIADPRTRSASGTRRPASTSAPASRSSSVSVSAVATNVWVGAQRDRRGLVHGDERGAPGDCAELGGEPLDQPVRVRQRDRVARRFGPRLREAGERLRRLAFDEPASVWRTGTDRGDAGEHRGVRRRVTEQLVGAEPQRDADRRIEPGQRALHHVSEQVVEPALRGAPSGRPGRW